MKISILYTLWRNTPIMPNNTLENLPHILIAVMPLEKSVGHLTQVNVRISSTEVSTIAD